MYKLCYSYCRRADADESAAAERTGDEDEDEDEGVDADEETLLASVVECVGQGLKAYHSPFLQILAPKILPVVQVLLPPDRPSSDRTAAICVFDDIIEHCSADGGSAPFVAQGTPVLLRYSADESPDVRQAALYGLGVLAEHAGAALTDEQCLAAVTALLAVVSLPTARDEDWENATDNGVSALGKVLLFREGALGNDTTVLDTWLGYLPVRADLAEAQIVHAQLCSLVERHGVRLLGAQGERAPAVTKALVKVVTSFELADSATRQRAAVLLLSLRAQPAAAAALSEVEEALSETERSRLHAALSAP